MITTRARTPDGLTTGKAPYVEQSRCAGQLFIEQPYVHYSAENHETWRRLVTRMRPRWERYAHPRFVEGLGILRLDWENVPKFEDVNRFMAPRTGFRARAVSGFVPAYQFFGCLAEREFPTTIAIRDGATLDYLPEPDIFHDVAGHVPMHTDPAFAAALVRLGGCAGLASRLAREVRDERERREALTSMIRAIARFFWFTIEFGLMRDGERVTVCGSGLLSSYGEIVHCLGPEVERFPFDMKWVVNQSFEIDRYQPLLFVLESFEDLFERVGELESWLRSGRLMKVAEGEPVVSQADWTSFLEAR